MIETLLLAYVIIGAIYGLIIWHTSFQPDFDDFVRDEYGEEPATTAEKWWTVFASLILWPYYLWKMFL